ncbi:MAG TPA: hypothetical protein PKD09_17930 [Aggregatilinea sp.]|uniref:hypothetical protein n=1 Tax=Aggregatilinea sp. TaxID=2806333 RepID=UPI002D131399|nr:hypothetical protein [Aggregatilinea sp.]HML23541.1 hypothetical protein [Aggregatilinea sp.]
MDKAQFKFSDSLWNELKAARMKGRFVDDTLPDASIASDFCYICAHLETARFAGTDKKWKPVDDTASLSEFRICYSQFFEWLTDVGGMGKFYEFVRVINDLKAPLATPVEKPAEALTEEEAADPN